MKIIVLTLIFIVLNSCSLFHEKETTAPKTVLKQNDNKQQCQLSDSETLSKALEQADTELLANNLNCISTVVDDAFKQVKGQNKEELSISEIKTLIDNNAVEISEEIKSKYINEYTYNILNEVSTLFNPNGNSSINRITVQNILAKIKEALPLLKVYKKYKNKLEEPEDFAIFHKEFILPVIKISKEILHSFGSNAHFKITFLKAAKNYIEKSNWIEEKNQIPDLSDLYSLWRAKVLIFGDDEISDLRWEDILKLVDSTIEIIEHFDQTSIYWIIKGADQNIITSDRLYKDMIFASQKIEDLLTDPKLGYFKSSQLQSLLKASSPKDPLYSIAPDLVRLSQKLNPLVKPGLHLGALIPLVRTLPDSFKEFSQYQKYFKRELVEENSGGNKYSYYETGAFFKDLYKDENLRKILFKGDLYDRCTNRNKKFSISECFYYEPERLLNLIIKKNIVKSIFDLFDINHDGSISLYTKNTKEEKEALELSYTIIRVASVFSSNKKENDDKTKSLEPVVNPIPTKPLEFIRLISLMGDEWMPDGNSDGKLNSDEFFSILQLFEKIQDNSYQFAAGNLHYGNFKKFYLENPIKNLSLNDFKDPIFMDRADSINKLIQNYTYTDSNNAQHNHLHLSYFDSLPIFNNQLSDLKPATLFSLVHSLIPTHDEIKTLYETKRNSDTYPESQLYTSNLKSVASNYYIETSDLFPLATYVTLMEVIMYRCDYNEDLKLDWKEMDCALPLILKSSNRALTTGLVSIDPIIQAGASLLTQLLQSPGIPLTVAKLVLVNGTIRENHLEAKIKDILANPLNKVDWKDLAYFIGQGDLKDRPDAIDYWIIEAQKTYGYCNFNSNQWIDGKEIDCVVDKITSQIDHSVKEISQKSLKSNSPISAEFIQAAWKEIKTKPLYTQILKTSLLDPDKIFKNEIASFNNILTLTESATRREKALCQPYQRW